MDDNLIVLLDAAEACGPESVLTAMGAHANPSVAQDVPVAAEMFGLLRHFLGTLPRHSLADGEVYRLAPGIYENHPLNQAVAFIPIQAGELDLIAYWLAQSVQSPKMIALPGLLVLPFSIEEHDGRRWLIPEWFALFYVDSAPDHCVPLLALRSVLDDGRFSDWVDAALVRAAAFRLPTVEAVQAAAQVIIQKTRGP